MTESLIEVFQKRLDKSAEDWRNTRTHQMSLIREAETAIWEEALKLAKEHAQSEIRLNDPDFKAMHDALQVFRQQTKITSDIAEPFKNAVLHYVGATKREPSSETLDNDDVEALLIAYDHAKEHRLPVTAIQPSIDIVRGLLAKSTKREVQPAGEIPVMDEAALDEIRQLIDDMADTRIIMHAVRKLARPKRESGKPAETTIQEVNYVSKHIIGAFEHIPDPKYRKTIAGCWARAAINAYKSFKPEIEVAEGKNG
jgi:hypothetical protein